jgi:hypothetical protein
MTIDHRIEIARDHFKITQPDDWQGRERNYSDWSSELACATCGAELPEVPQPRVSKETETEVSK